MLRHLEFYKHVTSLPGSDSVEQWGSLPTFYQYGYVFDQVAPFLPSVEHALDWGCGNGHFSYWLRHNQVKVTGYSLQDRPAVLSSDLHYQYQKGTPADPIKIPFSDDQFDVVFSIGVLEHVDEFGGDLDKTLQEIHRILRKGGRFFCFHFPNKGSWIEAATRRLIKLTGRHRFHHDRLFDREEITSFCERHHFEIEKIGRYHFLPRNLLNRLPPRLANGWFASVVYNALDRVGSLLFPGLCQNWFFVVRK